MTRDLLILMRAPLAAGAVSNMVLGLLLGRGPDGVWTGALTAALLALVLATCCFYWAGMVLNDFCDRERDRSLHPRRPIPAGRIKGGAALGFGIGLLLVGLVAAGCAGHWGGRGFGRGLLSGGLVVACVLAYDGWLKRCRVVGSLAMASCRLANVLLPALALDLDFADPLRYGSLLGVYVFSLTLLSTYEERDAPSGPLVAGFLGCFVAPIALLGLAAERGGGAAAIALPALLLMGLVSLQLFRSIERGTRALGGRQTVRLLEGIWLLDLGALFALGLWPALAGWGALYGLGTLGTKALFSSPRA